MGWCHEFGATIHQGCGHPMRAGESSCSCTVCGVVCPGRFAGCPTVWARGPREVSLVRHGNQAGQPVPAVAMSYEDNRAEVMEWLRASFEGVRNEIRILTDTVSRHQQALAERQEPDPADAELAELVSSLPERIGMAVSEAIRSLATWDGGQAPVEHPPAAPVEHPPAAPVEQSPRLHTAAGRYDWQASLRSLRPSRRWPTDQG